ncbi:hypothetical protein D3C87_1459390 [compost metagenome]
MDRLKQGAFARLHADPVQPGDIDHGDVEGLVRLVLQRAVKLAVGRIERQVAQVAGPSAQGADQPTVEVIFGQEVGEGIIDMAALDIDGDALHMTGIPRSTVLAQRQPGEGLSVGPVRRRSQRLAGKHSDHSRGRKRHARNDHRSDRTWRNTEFHSCPPPATTTGSRAGS